MSGTGERQALFDRLEEVRARTWELVEPLDEERREQQITPILSPMIWDLGHVASFEEMWLVQRAGGRPPVAPELAELFDPARNPRPTRAGLPLPRREALRDYLARVRAASREIVLGDDYRGDPELARPGYAVELVAQHEEQHQETLLQALQLLEDPPYTPVRRREPPPPDPIEPEMVEIPAGPCLVGAGPDAFAYDNELQQHQVDLPTFQIDRYPVTNGEFREFVDAGGYRDRALWSDAGWAWVLESGAECPGNWRRADGEWRVRYVDRELPLPTERPVVQVSHHEAEAYACFVGRRLPTEFEWEKAALWDPEERRPRRYPWGDESPTEERANLDQLTFAPAPVGSYPLGASYWGVQQLAGDVWEWTSSDFRPYPGFVAWPYPEYSEVFFGDEYRVLRGGSWATTARLARGTFRNWDYPIRRQIFAGLRCARDT